jgi:hypothetical protein
MRFASPRACRRALCSLVSWSTLTLALLLGASVVLVLLAPVARDVAHSLRTLYRAERPSSAFADPAPQPAAGIAAHPWAAFGLESPDDVSDDSQDIEVRRVR